MKPILTTFFATFLINLLLLSSCTKENHTQVSIQKAERGFAQSSIPRCPPGEDPVVYYSNAFLTDDDFAFTLDRFMYSSMNMQQAVGIAGGSIAIQEHHQLINSYRNYASMQQFYLSYGIDTAYMLQNHAEPMAAYIHLWDRHPEFADLTMQQQLSVIEKIKLNLLDSNFRAANPGNPLVIKINGFIAVFGNNQALRLSLDEVVGCAFGAIGATIAGAWGVMRDLYNVIQGHNLGFSGIVRVTKSALRTLIGGNIVGMVVEFAFCVVGAAIF
jgi:hypothetical protein